MKRALTSFAVFLLSAVGFSSGAMAACPGLLTLPTATGANSVTFGDGISYSLPILGLDVQSSPGQINDCIVIATGSSGGPINTNFAGMDNAYSTPSGVAGSTWFRTGAVANGQADPGGATQFTGDTATTWDTRITALNTFLGGFDPVIYFNHNQVNSGDAINQDLFVWAQIRLVDDLCMGADGVPISAAACAAAGGAPTRYFYVAAVNGIILNNFGNPGGDPTLYTGPQEVATCTYPEGSDAGLGCFPTGGVTPAGYFTATSADFMVQGRGQVCLNGPVGVGVPIPCDGSLGPVVATVNNNLGADEVANAVVFPEINDLLASGLYDVLQVDLRMGCNPETIESGTCSPGSILNNGFEQLFIGRLNPQLCVGPGCAEIPEPTTLALLALGLFAAGLGGLRRRKI